jgi:hypothetical protein
MCANYKEKQVVFHTEKEALDFIKQENKLLKDLDISDIENSRKFIASKAEYKGFKYYIVRYMNDSKLAFNLCGYVVLNQTVNPFFLSLLQLLDRDYKTSIVCHGGLTYEGNNFIESHNNELMIGFDCSHAGDIFTLYNLETVRAVSGGSYKTFYFVEDGCHSIIEQLIKIIEGN